MTHAYHKRLFQPTGCDACVKANFINEQTNLIIARNTCLFIYVLRLDGTHAEKLDLVREFNLYGIIEAVEVVRFPNNRVDSLILSFCDAKLSVVEWDASAHDLRVEALHFYENDDKLKEGRVQFVKKPKLVVSHDNKCAVTLSYDRELLLIPFRQESSQVDANVHYSEAEIRRKFPQSYPIFLYQINILHVKDMTFLHGYYEPTLLILHETFQTYATRLPQRKNTCSITALSLNITQRKNPVVWSKLHIPWDSYKTIAVPIPIGGVLIVASNSIYYFNQTTSYGITFNHFGDTQDSPYKTEKSPKALVLENVVGVWLTPRNLLLSIDGSGDLFMITLFTQAHTVIRFSVDNVGTSVLASSMCKLTPNFLFIGSNVGDSLLLKFTENQTVDLQNASNEANLEEFERPAKRIKTHHAGDEGLNDHPISSEWEGFSLSETEDKDLGKLFLEAELKKDTINTYNKRTSFEFKICDKLLTLSSIVDATVQPSMDDATMSIILDGDDSEKQFTAKSRQKLELVCTSGRRKNSGLVLLQRGVRPEINTAVEVPGCKALWSVFHLPKNENGSNDKDINQTPDLPWTRFVVLSRDDRTMVLETGDIIQEISNRVEFFTDGPTIDVGNVLSGRYIIQIHSNGAILLDGTERVEEWPLPSPEVSIIRSEILDPFILLQLSNRSLVLLFVRSDSDSRISTSSLDTENGSSIAAIQTNSTENEEQRGPQKRLVQSKINFEDNQSQVSSFTLFRDQSRSAIFNFTKHEPKNVHKQSKASTSATSSTFSTATNPSSTQGLHSQKENSETGNFMEISPLEEFELPGISTQKPTESLKSVGFISDTNIIRKEQDSGFDPDELELYGPSYFVHRTTDNFSTKSTDQEFSRMDYSESEPILEEENIERPYYCAVTLDNGNLQIFRFTNQSMQMVFHASHFCEGSAVVSDESQEKVKETINVGTSATASDITSSESKRKKISTLKIQEIAVHSLGSDYLAPYFFALLNTGELLVYKSFYYPNLITATHGRSQTYLSLPLRLRRIEQNLFFYNLKRPVQRKRKSRSSKMRGSRKKSRDDVGSSDEDDDDLLDDVEDDNLSILATIEKSEFGIASVDDISDGTKSVGHRYKTLRKFDYVAGHKGIFMLGVRPVWIFCERDSLRFHPMTVDGQVNAFTPFHNSSNQHGFIYYCVEQSKMKISQLSTEWNMELSWPCRKMEFGAENSSTMRHVVYDAASRMLAVVTVKPVVDQDLYYQPELFKNTEAEKPVPEEEIKSIPLPERLPDFSTDKYSLHLVDPETWKFIHAYHFEEQEVVQSIKIVNLNVKQNDKMVLQPFVAVGTSYVKGEDQGSKGRILIFDALRPRDVTQSKFELLFEKSERGPISCVCQLEGMLVCCIGMKILLFQFEDRKNLVGVAFFDCQIMIIDAVSIKNYIILADMYKSIYFLRWKDRARQLELLAKDFDPLHSIATEFLIDGNKLTFLVSDAQMNVHMFSYAPRDKESRGGQKLLCTGNFFLGSHIGKFLRFRMNRVTTTKKIKSTKYCAFYTALDGSVGSIVPIDQSKFEKLGRLEMRMVSALPHIAGLNPKAFRLCKPAWKMSHNHVRSTIDGELLARFAFLERSKQDELAGLVGLTTEEILDFLVETEISTSFF